MKFSRDDENNYGQRTTRWDLIKKRHSTNSTAFKSGAVKLLLERDYIGSKQRQRLVQDASEVDPPLNPAVVMQLRHEMCKRLPRALPLATVQQKSNDAWCKQHNQLVGERQITNELNKLREQLNRQRERHKLEVQSTPVSGKEVSNKRLMHSLRLSAQHIEDFYKAPLEAYNDMQLLFEEAKQRNEMEKENNINSVTRTNEFEENISAEINEFLAEMERSEYAAQYKVRTDETPEVKETKGVICVHIQRENSFASNTSDGIDSVISDLAEEALRELQEEEATENLTNITLTQESKEIVTTNEVEPKNDCEIVNNCIENEPTEALIVRRLELPIKPTKTEKKILFSELSTESDEESVSNHEQNKIIEQLFQSRAHTNIVIMRKYFLHWIHFTNMEKISRENVSCKATRVQQINSFLNKLRKEKLRAHKQPINNETTTNEHLNETTTQKAAKAPPHVTKKYQNKIKMQQDIIDLQRLKLERQERIIMELKLHKLSDEAKEAREELKQELKNVIQSGDPKAKAKAKCLQLIGNLRDKQDEEEDELAKLQGRGLFMPKFLQKMQERALERSIKHEQARQRRLQAEAEREALKIAAEEARRLEDEDAKQQRIDALREKRRQEKLAKIHRQQQRQREIENHRKAQQFCRLLILKRIGMEGFKRLLARKHENRRHSEAFRRHLFQRNCFHAWRKYCEQLRLQKWLRATLLHEKFIKRRSLLIWQQYVANERSKYLVAVDWHELHLSDLIFKEWFHLTKRNQMQEFSKMRQAVSHHEWNTKWKVLDCWQRLPQILQLERETEERRQRWRMKIWELLPDYQPNREIL